MMYNDLSQATDFLVANTDGLSNLTAACQSLVSWSTPSAQPARTNSTQQTVNEDYKTTSLKNNK